jgi:hypothetical protein
MLFCSSTPTQCSLGIALFREKRLPFKLHSITNKMARDTAQSLGLFNIGELRLRKKQCAFIITGVGCVGKTTIGGELADLLDVNFFDLDLEVKKFFGTSLQRLQNKFLTIHSYRDEAAKELVHLLVAPKKRGECNSPAAERPDGRPPTDDKELHWDYRRNHR